MAGWVIVLARGDEIISRTITNDNGEYWFMNLPPAEYYLFEIEQDGWRQTFPTAPYFHKVDLASGEIIDDADFGNWQPDPGSPPR